jgi:hypothetical protein
MVGRKTEDAKVVIVTFSKKDTWQKFLGQTHHKSVPGTRRIVWISLSILLCGFPALAQTQQLPPGTGTTAGPQLPAQQTSGSISGKVIDQSGAPVGAAHVSLTSEDPSMNQEAVSDNEGQFSFPGITPGPFQVTITAEGFATQVFSGTLHAREISVVPPITLALASTNTDVQVNVPQIEVAEEQIKEQEQQRVLAVIPNFYISYDPHPVPLTSKQKFELAWKTTLDPVTFAFNGVIAGAQQAENHFGGYGQGAQGFGKRYGADYADSVTSIFIGSAILPSLLKQDPRYFYKGTGSTRSRILYAIANAVICKGDNGHWQTNYSNMLGSLASGAISNLYYPAANRNGAELTFEDGLIGLGGSAVANLLQEFLIRKLTPKVPKQSKP